MTFIPGKKYKNSVSNFVAEALYVTDKGVLFRFDFDKAEAFFTNFLHHWKEYKEPVIHTRYVHWWKRKSGGPMVASIQTFVSIKDESCLHDLMKVDTVTYVEGDKPNTEGS